MTHHAKHVIAVSYAVAKHFAPDDNWVLAGNLLVGTALSESGFEKRRQYGNGPARGLWQMEETTARDIMDRYLRQSRKEHLRFLLWELCEITDSLDLMFHVEHNDVFSCALARIRYMMDPDPIPDTLEEQALYWKRIYNTKLGRGDPHDYCDMWRLTFGGQRVTKELEV